MSPNIFVFFSLLAILFVRPVLSITSYANDFIDPAYIIAKSFNTTTDKAQGTVIDWANNLNLDGPWSVVNKTATPPSGDKHDYMSWAPYSWPDCSSVGNTTALSDEEVWTTCPYVTRDGEFNPDVGLVTDSNAFQAMSDAVLYSALAWVLGNQTAYATTAAMQIRTWFLDTATAMNPNLDYGQMKRGPTGQTGAHTGVLDLKCMTKVANAILILRDSGSTEWTSELDSQMVEWTKKYISWLQTASIAQEEGSADNNHGTFYYNQLASLQILANDKNGAYQTIKTYFEKQYLSQIDAQGDQPLESARTRPFHYRAYNLAAMITNARLGTYIGFNAWTLPTSAGSTIQTAADHAMSLSAASEQESELYPVVAAVGAVYGDPDNKYAGYLKQREYNYAIQPYFLWNQPLSDSGYTRTTGGKASASATTTTHKSGATHKSSASDTSGDVALTHGRTVFQAGIVAILAVSAFVL
ncbi:chondroitin AC/alginate lyase [Heliocybe sulcata]|uniref:Chondroitin AC/alginate lyase n=1 Tax=Heliocybe sulcata TaxID=5364 RepID=A0A5C3N9V7_9AGAM|nr:chondroitin AC/alginate lyase [Heliocybe sulcata]